MFKINSQINQLIKIAAILQLLIVVVDIIAGIGNIEELEFNSTILPIINSALSVLLLLYIIGVLGFFGEKKNVIVAFVIYAILEFIFAASVIILVSFHTSPSFNVFFISILGMLIIIASIYIFIMAFFIRNRFIFSPIVLFTGSLLAIVVFKMLISTIFPLIDRADAGTLNGVLMRRKVVNWVSALSILMPVAIILLTGRVNQFIRSQQALNL